MKSILERFKSQKQELAKAEVDREDEAMMLALAGKPLSPEQVACLDDQKVALAERRGREGEKVRDVDVVVKHLPSAEELVKRHRQALKTAIDQANAKYTPLILDAERALQALRERETQGRRSLMWLIDATPAHVAAPLQHLQKRVVREEQYLENNLRALNQMKASLQAAKDGTLPLPVGLEMNSGSRGAAGDNALRKARDRQYSKDQIASLKAERDRLQEIYDQSKQRVDDLRSKARRLEALRLEPWPSHAAVTGILGTPWDAVEAAKNPLPDLINAGFGTPSAARVG